MFATVVAAIVMMIVDPLAAVEFEVVAAVGDPV